MRGVIGKNEMQPLFAVLSYIRVTAIEIYLYIVHSLNPILRDTNVKRFANIV